MQKAGGVFMLGKEEYHPLSDRILMAVLSWHKRSTEITIRPVFMSPFQQRNSNRSFTAIQVLQVRLWPHKPG
jgi:hypothetical protein